MEGEPFKLLSDYHQRANGFMLRALELDEQSSIYSFSKIIAIHTYCFLDNNETAILSYKQGIRELEKAVKLNIDPNSKVF